MEWDDLGEVIIGIELFPRRPILSVFGECLGAAAGTNAAIICPRLRVYEVLRGVPPFPADRLLDDVVREGRQAVLGELQTSGVRIAEPPQAFERVTVDAAVHGDVMMITPAFAPLCDADIF
ncbi:hypothetical protein SDC9_185223 [bioreactor metagenome]|uniref:Uncharacterized protein n=1 Tax=bioreactor metagenome TaxID=1076179 RepID=A0A645HQR7_9ZZZZ